MDFFTYLSEYFITFLFFICYVFLKVCSLVPFENFHIYEDDSQICLYP